jgi:hypothetical protein
LPNIAPSLLCLLPPPTNIPPLPLANARTGHASARSSLTPTPAHCTTSPTHPSTSPPRVCPSPPRGMWANDTPRHRPNPPPPRSLPTANPNRHVTGERARVRHVTAVNNPHPPPHHPKPARTPRHGRRRPPPLPTTRTPATSPPPTTPTSRNGPSLRDVGAQIDGWERGGARRIGQGSEEAREGGMRMQGNGGRRGRLYEPPPSLFSYQKPTRRRKNYAPPRSSSIISPERWGGFISRAASTMEQREGIPLLHFERV